MAKAKIYDQIFLKPEAIDHSSKMEDRRRKGCSEPRWLKMVIWHQPLMPRAAIGGVGVVL